MVVLITCLTKIEAFGKNRRVCLGLQLEDTAHHAGEVRQQEFKAAGHTTFTARKQRVDAAVIQFLLFIQPVEWLCSSLCLVWVFPL